MFRASLCRQVARTSGAAASPMQMYSDGSWCEHASIPKKQLPRHVNVCFVPKIINERSTFEQLYFLLAETHLSADPAAAPQPEPVAGAGARLAGVSPATAAACRRK